MNMNEVSVVQVVLCLISFKMAVFINTPRTHVQQSLLARVTNKNALEMLGRFGFSVALCNVHPLSVFFIVFLTLSF